MKTSKQNYPILHVQTHLLLLGPTFDDCALACSSYGGTGAATSHQRRGALGRGLLRDLPELCLALILCLLPLGVARGQVNDTCAGAIALVSGVAVTNNFAMATTNGKPVLNCGSGRPRGLWYTFSPTSNGRMDLDPCGSDFIPVWAVFTNGCGNSNPALCSYTSPSCGRLSFSARSNTTYHILVGLYSGGGNLRLLPTFAPSPAFDTCAGAIALEWGVTNTVSTTNATEVGDPVPSCGVNFGRGVWFSFTATSNETLNLSTCGSTFRTTVAIYTSGCGTLAPMLCNQVGGSGSCSRPDVQFPGVAGTTYRILVGGYNGEFGTLRIVAQRSPTNDTCTTALTLVSGVTNVVNTITATTNGDSSANCWSGVPRAVWYKVTPQIDQRMNISTVGSDFDTVLAVYTNTCGNLGLLQCVDNFGPLSSSVLATLSFNGKGQTTYHILAGGASGGAGNLRIAVDLRDPPVNDTCANPVVLVSGETNSTDISFATEAGDPNPACSTISRGVWYTFTPAFDGRLNLSAVGSDFPYVTLGVYTGACGALTPVRCTNGSVMNFSVSQGATYRILAGTYSGTGGALRIVANLLPPPTNDTCAGAIALEWGVTNTVSTTNATEVGDPVPSCGVNFGRGVWFSFTATSNETLNLSTCGSTFRTTVAIYTNGCGTLAPMLCNQVGGSGSCSRPDVQFPTVAGTTYRILVGGYNGEFGILRIAALRSPTNDRCAGAITLINGETNYVNTSTATSVGDPTPPCRSSYDDYDFDFHQTYGLEQGVWYTITPQFNQRVLVDKRSGVLSILSAYTGTCESLTGVQPNGCSADREGWIFDSHSYVDARLNFSAAAGVTYYVLAGGYTGTDLRIVATVLTPPSNDECANPTQLLLGVTNTLDTTGATEIGDPAGIGHGVWYAVTPPRDSGIAISTCGSSFSTAVRVYTGTCGALSEVPVVATPLCGVASGRASVTFAGLGGTTYYVFVGGSNPTAAGDLRIIALESPVNDTCVGAFEMTPGIIYTNNTLTATDTIDPVPACVPASSVKRGVWYKYTAPMTGRLSLSSLGSWQAIYSGGCDTNLTQERCSLSSSGVAWPSARLSWDAVANTTYYFLAQGDPNSGELRILIPVVDLVSAQPFATNSTGGPPIAGRTMILGWGVTNLGQNPVQASWKDRLSLSNVRTNEFPGTHFAPNGGGYVNTTVFTLPPVAAGLYTLIAETDLDGQVVETNENNNARVVSVWITNLPPTARLVAPTNDWDVTSCVPVAFDFAATTQMGSYTITNVGIYAGAMLVAQTNRPPYQFKNIFLPHDEYNVTAQAVDNFGLRGTSAVIRVSVRWPEELHRLRADLNTNGDCVICMRALPGSNYVVETTIDLREPIIWRPGRTNSAIGPILIFTNRPVDMQRYFRTWLWPYEAR